MILTKEQAKERLGSNRNLLNRFGKRTNVIEITPLSRPGRPEGSNGQNSDIPEDVKVEIATRARLGESDRSLAAEFGVDHTTVSHFQRGTRSVDEKAVEQRMNEIQDVAMCKLLASLGFLDDEKMKKMSGKDLSAVAANMAKVAGSVRPSMTENNQVHLHLYAPELRKEANFKTIEV